MLDRESPLPMYYQIERYIEQLIEKKHLQAGDRIPSERELTDRFHVSRMTVRQAVMNLVNAGSLVRVKGKGTFVSDQNKVEKALRSFNGFSEDMVNRGMEPGSRLLTFARLHPPPALAQQFQLDEQDDVFQIRRVRFADHAPMAIENSFIPVRLVPELTERDVASSLYRYIEQERGLTIDYVEQSIEAAVVTTEEAKILQIPKGSPVLLIERRAYLKDGRPVEQTKSLFRADRYKFMVTLPRG